MTPIDLILISAGETLHAKFYPAQDMEDPDTFLFIPGWPACPEDFLDLGPNLSQQGIHFIGLFPRGLPPSQGTSSFSNCLEDIGAALRYFKGEEIQRKYTMDPSRITLGGYSYGGGMAMAYAAQDPTVRRIISIAGNDHGEFARELGRNGAFASEIRKMLKFTQAPDGPARFDIDQSLQELLDHPEIFGLRENAVHLADRSILLFGGWDDSGATIEQYLLPFYRALKKSGAEDVTFIVYHTNHSFTNVLPQLSSDIASWLRTR